MDKAVIERLTTLQLRLLAHGLGAWQGEKGCETESVREMGEQLFVAVRTSPCKCVWPAFGLCVLGYNSNL